jgi:hypothetical protein
MDYSQRQEFSQNDSGYKYRTPRYTNFDNIMVPSTTSSNYFVFNPELCNPQLDECGPREILILDKTNFDTLGTDDHSTLRHGHPNNLPA